MMKHRLYVIAFVVLLLLSHPLSLISQSKDSEKKKWDVTEPIGPTKTVEFTTTEGTWMNLDVSPDGKEIVFDLLGDLYTLPIKGGKAKLLSGGPAYEVQPRFSPDGTKISFTSDKGGGDNIWVMNRDGSDPKAVSNEDFRLLNNACWTPDGNYLIARKHFTSRRSLGAGEMWIYHITGGKGLQLTKRKNDQQDAGEPCVSPDGRYIYFSEDMSGGSTFQYNKDPNGQIYMIRRLDRQTGEIKNIVTGPGGAVRPQMSPDGQHLAFVRRVRTKSVLYLHRLSTGEQWPIYDGLNKDQQEAWAIFGVHPNYAWTPDGKDLVFWAKGKIWRIDVGTRAVVEIPFEVQAKHLVHEAIRIKQNISPDEFEVKMVRQTTTSPDGKWLVFNAVGHLWKLRIPNGRVERLTNDEHFEYAPAFSPDGKTVVYTTWSDDEFGAIYKTQVNGGTPQRLSIRKGYYLTPAFSPDGQKIVYQRGTGNNVLGFTHGVDPGLYWMDADGGPAHLIRESGRDPRFNRPGDRVYFLDRAKRGKKAFKSVRLDGGDERTHFITTYATQIVPSPDEEWLAFVELFNGYIAPFPKTGSAIDLNGNTKAVPITKVTRDAGTYLHWSGDSQKLHWTIGPEYFTRELKDSFAFVSGSPKELPPPDSTGLKIRLNIKTDIPTGKLALVGARLITMNGDEVIDDGTVVVEGNTITAAGSSPDIRVPSDATIIDVTGKTIIPGLVDVHAHLRNSRNGITPQQNWPYFANLAFGVTTAHDPSAATETVFSQSEMVRAGKLVGPRIFSTGTILYGADGDFKAVVNSLDNARSHLRRMKAVGAFTVKSYNQPRRNQRQQILKAARELGIMVVPEGGSTFFHDMTMILDGHTGIEHSIPVTPVYKDVIELWSSSGTGYTPTLVVSFGAISGEYYWYQHTNVWENSRLLNFFPRPTVDARSRRRLMVPEDDFGHISISTDATALVNAGGKVQLGAHGQLQGLAAHWELWMLEQGGMTPLQAIRAATLDGAYYIGLDDQIGSLAAGKLADLVVMNANPLENIRNTESIAYVMKNGRLYDAETMHEIGNHSRQRALFYWEKPNASDAFVWRGTGVGFEEMTCGCTANP
ncbi:amidohydrolase family protein [bacterium]|nr:amidohydrolase family protein [bacterium]